MFDLKKTTSQTLCELYAGYAGCADHPHFFHGDRENWNLLMPGDSVATLTIGSRKVVLESGRLFLISPGIDRTFLAPEDWGMRWVHFNIDAHLQYEPEWTELVPGVCKVDLDKENSEVMARIFDDIIELCRTRMIGWYRLGYCLVQEIILRGNMIEKHGYDADFIKRVVKLLENFSLQTNIRELAAQCSMSRTSFYRQFKNVFGVGPREYHERWLMNKAQSMLEGNDFSIAEIAYKINCGTPAYFATRFKALFGMSPSEYRRKHQRVKEE